MVSRRIDPEEREAAIAAVENGGYDKEYFDKVGS